MRCFLVLLCVTLASTGPDTPQAGFWTWIPALTHLQGALRTWIPVVDLDTSLAEHKDPDFGADILEAEEPASVFCPVSGAGQSAGIPDLDLSHPEDLFAESGELDWICQSEPGALEERMAEEETELSEHGNVFSILWKQCVTFRIQGLARPLTVAWCDLFMYKEPLFRAMVFFGGRNTLSKIELLILWRVLLETFGGSCFHEIPWYSLVASPWHWWASTWYFNVLGSNVGCNQCRGKRDTAVSSKSSKCFEAWVVQWFFLLEPSMCGLLAWRLAPCYTNCCLRFLRLGFGVLLFLVLLGGMVLF